MAGIRAQSDWISGYAKTADSAADSLHDAAGKLTDAPLGSDAFGDLGRTMRTSSAYQHASSMLLGQLNRASTALNSAAEQLRKIADEHSASEDKNVAMFARVDQR